jgi:DNA-binding SARP family transcriptional activator
VHFSVLADEEPEQEGWHRGIMRCHSAAGERALALRQFHTCRSVLRQSRGVEPSPETQALYIELLKARSGGG